MPMLPGISNAEAVRVLGEFGFCVARPDKHAFMSNGRIRLTIPRHTLINPFTMSDIAHDAGLTPEQFCELL